MNLVTEKIKFATVKYETAKKTEPVTAVWRYGWFRFSVAGKSKAGNLHIFTLIRSTCRHRRQAAER